MTENEPMALGLERFAMAAAFVIKRERTDSAKSLFHCVLADSGQWRKVSALVELV